MICNFSFFGRSAQYQIKYLISYSIVSMKQENKHQFILIRHGQSVHNVLSEQVYLKYGAVYRSTPQHKSIRHNPDLIDGGLTQKGKIQAQSARQLLKNQQVNIVLVSPLRRALQTCDIIFGDQEEIQIFVEPLMCEHPSYSVDIGGRIKQSYQIYSKRFNFQKIKPQHINQQNWYLELLNEKTKDLILQKKQKQNLPYDLATLQVAKTHELQTYKEFKQRIDQLKQILQEYKNRQKKICLVGHGVLFKMLVATSLNPLTYQPENTREIQNASPEKVQLNLNPIKI